MLKYIWSKSTKGFDMAAYEGSGGIFDGLERPTLVRMAQAIFWNERLHAAGIDDLGDVTIELMGPAADLWIARLDMVVRELSEGQMVLRRIARHLERPSTWAVGMIWVATYPPGTEPGVQDSLHPTSKVSFLWQMGVEPMDP